MAGGMEFDLSFGVRGARRRPDEDTPLRVLIVADFGGARERSPDWQVRAVDIDNFDATLAQLGPVAAIPAAGEGEHLLELRALEDFHPDMLFTRAPAVAKLRDLRARLENPATYRDAADELLGSAGARGAAQAEPEQREEPGENEADTLERLLGARPAGGASRGERARSDVDALIKRLVAPHIEPGEDPQKPRLLAIVDDAIAGHLRELLHAPEFQRLEARWRSVHELVSNLDQDAGITLGLLDLPAGAMQGDIDAAAGQLQQTRLYNLLERALDRGQPWSVVVLDEYFGADPAELELVAALGSIASAAGAALLAAARPSLLGCETLGPLPDPRDWAEPAASSAWARLRAAPQACAIGLALPRVLMRLPYGERGEAVDKLHFEELPLADHEALLWGNPAFVCARLLAERWLEDGWDMAPGAACDITDLPAWVHDTAQGRELQPVAEVLLSERAADAVLARGIMPLVSMRDRNAARLARFQSIADPPSPLRGPW